MQRLRDCQLEARPNCLRAHYSARHGLLAAVCTALPDRAANGRGDPLRCEGDLTFSREPHTQFSCHPQVDALANKSLISEVTFLICRSLHSSAQPLPRRCQIYPEDVICCTFQSEGTEQMSKVQFRSVFIGSKVHTNVSYNLNPRVGYEVSPTQF